MKSPPPPKLTQEEIAEARIWWNSLAEDVKSRASIWIILALYAKHWADMHTVCFDADEPVRITEG